MSDNYELAKSMFPQSLEGESPYTSKQWNFVQDINGGIYSNNGLSLVQFDLSSIYNSTNLIQPDSMFLAVPITIVNTFVTNAGASIAPLASNVSAVGLKNGFFQLVHGADVAINGKTIQQFQPYTNAYVAFKTLSSMSQDDLKTLGPSLGMGEIIDNAQSLTFNGSAVSTVSGGTFPSSVVTGGAGGNGLSNNKPFALSGNSNFGDQASQTIQNLYTYNNGLASRQKRIIDPSQAPNAGGTAGQGLFGPSGGAGTSYITNLDNLKKEFKPNYQVVGTHYQTYQDVAIIRIADIFDSFKKLPLMKKLDATMRFYINTGTVVSNVKTSAGVTTSTGLQMSSGLSNTFTGTCPLMQCAQTLLPIDAGAQVSGLFIGSATPTSVNAFGLTVNLGTSAVSHFMPSCRVYYAQVQLKPEKMIPYIAENRAKRVVFTDFLTNTINAISASSSASSLVQSGVSSIRGILMLPFISASTNGANGASGISAFSQLQSPFDTAPATNGPLSLLNLQVAVGGVNQLSNTLNYAWENFLEQTTLYEKLNALDYGLSCGLISENYYEQAYRAYYVDLTRANEADLLTPRNVNVSFTNNTLQTLDVLVYTEYFKEIVVDVETGLINV
jgi:hypothetical protein